MQLCKFFKRLIDFGSDLRQSSREYVKLIKDCCWRSFISISQLLLDRFVCFEMLRNTYTAFSMLYRISKHFCLFIMSFSPITFFIVAITKIELFPIKIDCIFNSLNWYVLELWVTCKEPKFSAVFYFVLKRILIYFYYGVVTWLSLGFGLFWSSVKWM